MRGTYPDFVSGFALEQGGQALGVGCQRMLDLFSDIKEQLERKVPADVQR
jgi:hypothetical protein